MPNLNTFAKTIVDYSCSVQPGENVLILAEGLEAKPLVLELVKEVYRAGANPFFDLLDTDIQKAFISGCNERQMEVYSEFSLQKLKQMQALIVISALESPDKYATIPLQQMSLFNNYYMQRCFYAYGVMNTKWIYVKYPTQGMAKLFGQSQEVFEDYYFSVCTLDYAKLSTSMDKLVDLFSKTDNVRILANGTDITFSIRGITAQKSDGKNGLPDGEVFTAPVRNSANGVIQFNCPLYFRGTLLEDIRLVFESGKVVEATANDSARLNAILDLDENARYLGEFALSVNNRITSPMKDILFDEKIGGSLHLALGNAYITTDKHDETKSIAENILMMLRSDRQYTMQEAKLLDLCLVLHADHGGGNNSTFTVRTLTSALTDTYSAISAGIGSLKGFRHGGANYKVTEMLDGIRRAVKDPSDKAEIQTALERIVNREAGDGSGLVYGIGHAVYTLSDPRAKMLKSYLAEQTPGTPQEETFRIACAVEELAPEILRRKKGDNINLCANVDLYSGITYRLLGIPEELFTPLFCVSRVAGWCAHRMEELTMPASKIIRPAYKSIQAERSYIPLEER